MSVIVGFEPGQLNVICTSISSGHSIMDPVHSHIIFNKPNIITKINKNKYRIITHYIARIKEIMAENGISEDIVDIVPVDEWQCDLIFNDEMTLAIFNFYITEHFEVM